MRFLSALLSTAAIAAFAASANAAKFVADGIELKTLVTFGDSLSDTGNEYGSFVSSGIPAEPYYKGRWCNGPTYIEHLADVTGAKLISYAFGGSTARSFGLLNIDWPGFAETVAGSTGLLPLPLNPPGLTEQVEKYIASPEGAQHIKDPTTVHNLFSGNNDYLYVLLNAQILTRDLAVYATEVADSILANMEKLRVAGAKNFIVVGAPDLAKIAILQTLDYTPVFPVTYELADRLDTLVDTHNKKLKEGIAAWKKANPAVYVKFVDSKVIMQQLFEYFPRTEVSCYSLITTIQLPIPVCTQPDDFFFWDIVHPTAKAHRGIASWVIDNAFDTTGSDPYTNPFAAEFPGLGKGGKYSVSGAIGWLEGLLGSKPSSASGAVAKPSVFSRGASNEQVEASESLKVSRFFKEVAN